MIFGHGTKTTGNKSKNKEVGLSQTKSYYTVKKTINKMRRQPMEREKIFARHISDNGLIPRIYKELIKLNGKGTNYRLKMGKRHLYKEDAQIANRYVKRWAQHY